MTNAMWEKVGPLFINLDITARVPVVLRGAFRNSWLWQQFYNNVPHQIQWSLLEQLREQLRGGI